MNKKDIIVIPDTQVRSGVCTAHLDAISKYIWRYKPEYVVHLGDHYDFESISYYASKRESEGRRLIDDLKAGRTSLEKITSFIHERNRRAKGKTFYLPELHFCMGNHEHRLERLIDQHPWMEGIIDINAVIESYGWEVHKFLKPMEINGVQFMHYLQNPMTGRAVGGSMMNKLNKVTTSIVHGHQQLLQMEIRQQPHTNRNQFGVCAGAFYTHMEDYKGEQGNTHWRGFVHLKWDGENYNIIPVSIAQLMKEFG